MITAKYFSSFRKKKKKKKKVGGLQENIYTQHKEGRGQVVFSPEHLPRNLCLVRSKEVTFVLDVSLLISARILPELDN